ncbi:MAG TPA: histidine--tRNA ligase, partial [Candidatus Handelsmanbacteria bacterium]|nr:histidine--tRNA ligase [Candidatus Handelsmanbacteria bacterium]
MIPSIRGTRDILPAEVGRWQRVEGVARDLCARYGYAEVRTPVIEREELFAKGTGESTDIVQKEMYAFTDKGGDRITLRPEATPSMVRSFVEHALEQELPCAKLYSLGPMFRYERPQKGRYRQFDQIGAECFGMSGPDIDAELLLMCARLWQKLGISDGVSLELNSLGTAESRATYKEALVEYLSKVKDELDEDSQRRLTTNPLRILDSKVPGTVKLLEDAPLLRDYIDDESRQHLEGLCQILDEAGIAYTINPFIVRGLDYYNRTVFEWITDSLGAQGTICGGGRYDSLVEQIGGKPTPGVGFAMGMDRIALMMESNFNFSAEADVYVASIGQASRQAALLIAEDIRTVFPNLRTIVHCGDGKFKAQLKRANLTEAKVALIVGENEFRTNLPLNSAVALYVHKTHLG